MCEYLLLILCFDVEDILSLLYDIILTYVALQRRYKFEEKIKK